MAIDKINVNIYSFGEVFENTSRRVLRDTFTTDMNLNGYASFIAG